MVPSSFIHRFNCLLLPVDFFFCLVSMLHDVMSTNLFGTLYMCRGVLKSMLPRRYGRIINIGSVVATKGNSGQSIYGATKAGINGRNQHTYHHTKSTTAPTQRIRLYHGNVYAESDTRGSCVFRTVFTCHIFLYVSHMLILLRFMYLFVCDIGFSVSLSREVASRGVTVNVVAPGFIQTDMTQGKHCI